MGFASHETCTNGTYNVTLLENYESTKFSLCRGSCAVAKGLVFGSLVSGSKMELGKRELYPNTLLVRSDSIL